MPAPPPTRTGVLVVRAWLEDGRPRTFRARITWSLDVSRTEVTRLAASTPDEIRRLTDEWLDALVAGDGTMAER